MRVTRLSLTDFRNYTTAELVPAPEGLTVLTGENGAGKTNLLEAIAYLATLESCRGASADAMVRNGIDRAVIRAEGERDGRRLTVDVELTRAGRSQARLNGQPLRRANELLGALRVTVFAPDDLALVKGGPAERRRYADDVLVALHPRLGALQHDVDRVLRQRGALLRQAAGRLTDEVASTLDVWDERLARLGGELTEERERLVLRLEPELAKAYTQVAGAGVEARVTYQRSWSTPSLAEALVASRPDDTRRGVTLVGPHRDDLVLRIGDLAARTHASQGEQRSLAVALRLASHAVVTDAVGSPPVLLLDDVFSELDPARTAALVAHLPPGQALLTTAVDIPAGMQAQQVVRISQGRVT